MHHFVLHRLGLSERQLKTVTWPEMAKRVVEVPLTLAKPTLLWAPPVYPFLCLGKVLLSIHVI